jgi:hypothetical protein
MRKRKPIADVAEMETVPTILDECCVALQGKRIVLQEQNGAALLRRDNFRYKTGSWPSRTP